MITMCLLLRIDAVGPFQCYCMEAAQQMLIMEASATLFFVLLFIVLRCRSSVRLSAVSCIQHVMCSLFGRICYQHEDWRRQATMASTKEDSTAEAAEQLGSISLGDSVERKDNDNEPNGTPTKMCSKCGKKSNALMKCRACKCVWYCDKDCQNKHWKEHKKECKPIKKILEKRGGKLDVGTELDVGPLGEVPPREECPICMQVLPIHEKLSSYAVCCGKKLCGGCDYQHQMKSGETLTCAFCREPISQSAEEALVPLRKRVELKDPNAMFHMALEYGYGLHGLPVDQAKGKTLLCEAAGLGLPDAQFTLGDYYRHGHMGFEQNEEEALKYFKEAAEGGDVLSRHNVGMAEGRNGNYDAAMRHLRLSASSGDRKSIEFLISSFEVGMLRHGDLSETVHAFYRARAELKSDGRDKFIAYLKSNGQYNKEYDV